MEVTKFKIKLQNIYVMMTTTTLLYGIGCILLDVVANGWI